MREQSRAAKQLQDKRERAKTSREKGDHEKYHIGRTLVLQCRYCRANYVNFRKLKGRSDEQETTNV